jgi:hypothetical protein
LPRQCGAIFAHWASLSTYRSIPSLNHNRKLGGIPNLNRPSTGLFTFKLPRTGNWGILDQDAAAAAGPEPGRIPPDHGIGPPPDRRRDRDPRRDAVGGSAAGNGDLPPFKAALAEGRTKGGMPEDDWGELKRKVVAAVPLLPASGVSEHQMGHFGRPIRRPGPDAPRAAAPAHAFALPALGLPVAPRAVDAAHRPELHHAGADHLRDPLPDAPAAGNGRRAWALGRIDGGVRRNRRGLPDRRESARARPCAD